MRGPKHTAPSVVIELERGLRNESSVLPAQTSEASEPMMNCRSVSPEVWAHVRQALIFFFRHRHGDANAEDLAHETMVAVLTREDYQFEKEEDFLRVCYAFARRTGQAGHRRERKHAATDIAEVSGVLAGGTPNEAENEIFLKEVLRLGEEHLTARQWQAVTRAASDRADLHRELGFADANAFRVFLYRARRKLAEISGYRRR
jgi:DNA-directed RNA polymerase specialized sigma24 family protein